MRRERERERVGWGGVGVGGGGGAEKERKKEREKKLERGRKRPRAQLKEHRRKFHGLHVQDYGESALHLESCLQTGPVPRGARLTNQPPLIKVRRGRKFSSQIRCSSSAFLQR